MKKITLFAIAATFLLASCGEAPKKMEDKKEMSHDEMHEKDVPHEDHMEEEAEPAALTVPKGASVSFGNLTDGQTVSSPVKIEFVVAGMEVEPAGDLNQGKGHHHIIVDGGALDEGIIVPANARNIHFGKGQTETELELSVGRHSLTLQFADGYHQSYGEQMSKTIKITVE